MSKSTAVKTNKKSNFILGERFAKLFLDTIRQFNPKINLPQDIKFN